MADFIDVVHLAPEQDGIGKPFGGAYAFSDPGAHVGLSRLGPGAVTPWHHHGERTFYGYLVAGELRLEYGPGGKEAVTLRAGDFLRIPPGVVHRDVNASASTAVVATVVVGAGELFFEAPAPPA